MVRQTYAPVSRPALPTMTIQASTFDPSISAARAQEQVQGYWDNPAAPEQAHNHGTDELDHHGDVDLATGTTPPASGDTQAAAGDAVEINGGSTNPSGRTTGSTPDGKPIQIDALQRDATVAITRERSGRRTSAATVARTPAGDDKVGGPSANTARGFAINGRATKSGWRRARSSRSAPVPATTHRSRPNVASHRGDGARATTPSPRSGDDRIDGGAGTT